MDTLKNEKGQTEGPTALQRMQEELRMIDERFSNPDLQAQLDQFLASKGYVKAAPGGSRGSGSTKKAKGQPKSLDISYKSITLSDKNIVRYFLMQMLWSTGYEIVLHEFPYQRCLCDVMAVVGGRATEFELKCSRADYFQDFRKKIFTGRPVDKHGALANGTTMISRFYFVVPSNMVAVEECPAHAGMIWYDMERDYPVFRVVKYPALLNKQYLSPGTWQTIAKRLMVRCKGLTDRYVDTRFKEIRKGSIYNPTPTSYANNNPPDSPADAG